MDRRFDSLVSRQGHRGLLASHYVKNFGPELDRLTGLWLSRALGLSDMFWITMQAHYDAEIVRRRSASQLAAIERIA